MEVCSQSLNDPNTVLLKVNGNKCNMACQYCSELRKKFSPDLCIYDFEAIQSILNRLPKDVDIIFHGGEPSLIGMENIRKICLEIKKLGFLIKPTIQTNGFLNDEWVDFFIENRELLKISVSIDGDEECNVLRQTSDKNDKKAFEIVDTFLCNIDKNNLEFRCIATINKKSWDKGEKIIEYFFKFNNLRFLRINPCFDIDENGPSSWAITPSQYLSCLKDIFNEMIKLKSYEKFKIDPIMDIIDGFTRNTREYEFKCNKFSSIFPNGVITSCDAMREIKQNIRIDKNMFKSFTQPDYTNRIISKCNSCPEISLCKGGCPPLMNRYECYDKNLLKEYCDYRVGIRKYINTFLKDI